MAEEKKTAKGSRIDRLKLGDKTEQERKDYATMGGIKSGEVRREQKKLKEQLQEMMRTTIPQGSIFEKDLEKLGLDKKATTQTLWLWTMLYHSMQGNAQMAKLILDRVDEDNKDTEERQITIINQFADLSSTYKEDDEEDKGGE